MQAQANAWVPKQTLDERQIRAPVGLLQYSIEIADRLVSVDQENEAKLGQLGTPHNWVLPSYCDLRKLQRSSW